MKSTLLPLALACAPLPVLAAQTTTAPATPALVVRTADADLARTIADRFAFPDDLPEIGEKGCYVLTLANDRKLAVAATKEATSYLQVQARPAVLAEMFAERIEQVQQNLGGIAAGAATRFGSSPAEVSGLVEDVFAFPRQIESLDLDVTGSEAAGFDGKVAIVPVSGGWFAGFVEAIQRSAKGAPVLPDGEALFTAAADLDPATLARSVRPFLGFVVGAAAAGKETRKLFSARMLDLIGQLDGTFAFAIRGEGREHQFLAGVQDGAKARELLEGEDFRAWRQANAEANPMVETEVTEAALTHRAVACTRTVQNATGPTGEEVTTTHFAGAAGPFLFGAGNESDAKALIDAILDQKVARKALPGNALLSLSVQLAEIARVMSGGRADTEEVPSRVDIALAKQGAALNLTFKVAP